MASIFDLPQDHPVVAEAVENARALVTARMAITAVTPGEEGIYSQVLGEMVEKATMPPDMALYGAQLAALTKLATDALLMVAGSKDAPVDDVRATFFRVSAETGQAF